MLTANIHHKSYHAYQTSNEINQFHFVLFVFLYFNFSVFSVHHESLLVTQIRWNLNWKLNTILARVPTGREWGRGNSSNFHLQAAVAQTLIYCINSAAKSSCPNQMARPSRHYKLATESTSGRILLSLKWAQMGRIFFFFPCWCLLWLKEP